MAAADKRLPEPTYEYLEVDDPVLRLHRAYDAFIRALRETPVSESVVRYNEMGERQIRETNPPEI